MPKPLAGVSFAAVPRLPGSALLPPRTPARPMGQRSRQRPCRKVSFPRFRKETLPGGHGGSRTARKRHSGQAGVGRRPLCLWSLHLSARLFLCDGSEGCAHYYTLLLSPVPLSPPSVWRCWLVSNTVIGSHRELSAVSWPCPDAVASHGRNKGCFWLRNWHVTRVVKEGEELAL